MKKLSSILIMLALASVAISAQKFQSTKVSNINGRSVELAKRSPRMVTFYLDDCAQCRSVMSRINNVENELYGDVFDSLGPGFALFWSSPNTVVALARTESEKQQIIKRFDDNNWNKSHLLFIDSGNAFYGYARSMSVTEFPTVIVIDKNSNISRRFVGTNFSIDKLYAEMESIVLE